MAFSQTYDIDILHHETPLALNLLKQTSPCYETMLAIATDEAKAVDQEGDGAEDSESGEASEGDERKRFYIIHIHMVIH